MSHSELLHEWASARHKQVRERVLPTGEHHVWVSLFPGWRCESENRDYEEACRSVWRQILAVPGSDLRESTARQAARDAGEFLKAKGRT